MQALVVGELVRIFSDDRQLGVEGDIGGVLFVATHPGNAGVDGRTINPCRNFGLSSEFVETRPQVDDGLLIEVVEFGRRRGVDAADLGDDRLPEARSDCETNVGRIRSAS